MDKLEKLRKQRAELDKKIEALEYSEDYTFRKGDKYWVVYADGDISVLTWKNDNIDKNFEKQGNAFKTSKEAILEADRRALLHRFKMFRDKCNGEWEQNFYKTQVHHFIDFENSDETLFINSTFYKGFELFGYFKNKEDCDKAIDLFGDEIKRLYVEVRV